VQIILQFLLGQEKKRPSIDEMSYFSGNHFGCTICTTNFERFFFFFLLRSLIIEVSIEISFAVITFTYY